MLPSLIPINTSAVDPSTLMIDGGRFITVDGIQTYIVEHGPTDGTPVVFIHGLFGSTYTWRYPLKALADAGYRAIAFDRPGAGLSDKRPNLNYAHASQADFTAALLDALAIRTAIIIGHSAGGNVAAHFVLRHDDRANRLVIIDGALVGQSGPPSFLGGIVAFLPIDYLARIGMRTLFTQNRLADTLRSFYANPKTATPEVIAAYWRNFQTPSWDVGLIGLTRDSGNNKLTTSAIQTITTKTLLIWGERDTITPIAQGEELRGLLPAATFVRIAESGHQPMEEQPTAFNNALLDFLAQQ